MMAEQTQDFKAPEFKEFKNPEVKAKYEISSPAQRDVRIRVPNQYNGPISGITPEAAEQYVEKEKGRLIRKKTSATSLSLVPKSESDEN